MSHNELQTQPQAVALVKIQHSYIIAMNTGQSPDSPLPPVAPPPSVEKNMDEQSEPSGDGPAKKKGEHVLTAASALTNLGTSDSNDAMVGQEEISAGDDDEGDKEPSTSKVGGEEDNIPMSFPQRVSNQRL